MSDDKARREFEHWYSDEGASPAAVARSQDGYSLMGACTSWKAWQAAYNKGRKAASDDMRAHLDRMNGGGA